MPRLLQSLPKYRKHKASGQAFVELNGRRYYLGPHGTKASKVEYDRLIAEWLQHGRQLPPAPETGELTVVELIVAYLPFVKGYYRKDGRQPCTEFGPTAMKVVRQQIVNDGLARKLINQRVGRIKRMFKWGASCEMIPAAIRKRCRWSTG